jgi:hypothetical protein
MIRYRVLALALAGGRTPCRMRNLEDEDGRPRPSEALHQQGGPLDGYCGIVEVWENRQAQAGRRISLKVVVLPGARRERIPTRCSTSPADPPWIEPDSPQHFKVLFEDPHLLAVNIPSGLPTLPVGGFMENTPCAWYKSKPPTQTLSTGWAEPLPARASSKHCAARRLRNPHTHRPHIRPDNHHYRSVIKLVSLGLGMAGSRRFERPP